MKELEKDTGRKMFVVGFLYILSLFAVLAIYLSNTSYQEIEEWILHAIMPEELLPKEDLA